MLILHCSFWITAANVECTCRWSQLVCFLPASPMNNHWLPDMGKNTRIFRSNVRLRAVCKWLSTDRKYEQQIMLPRMEKLVRTILVSSSVLQNGAACGQGCPPAFLS